MASFRRFGFLCVFACGVVTAFVEDRIRSQSQPAAPNLLDPVLDNWERALKDVTAFEGQIVRRQTSKVFQTTEVREGRVRILKTPTTLFASLELGRKEAPGQTVEKLLLNDKGFCEYDFAAKEVRIHPLTERPDRADNPIGYLFGVRAKDLKVRFNLHFAGEDPNYFYIDIAPRTPRDKADFARAQLSLLRTTHMPAQLRFQQVNQDQTQWDITRINDKAAHLRPADFTAAPTQGWKLTLVPTVTAK